jgi:CheY-like chemotaxis protein
VSHPNLRLPTILVVDDEGAILRLLINTLGGSGFAVFTADQGAEAVEVYRRHQDEIDLVLLDIEMFPWDGPRTLAELRQIDPQVRAAFMSGSPSDVSAEQLRVLGVLALYPKPFGRIADLVDALEKLVGAKRSG